ncbi:MAG: hypothetical protein R3275_10110 [Saprospiraceae bacterium]|nr:hypothetical protein [Saprospiraceae bacterium]
MIIRYTLLFLIFSSVCQSQTEYNFSFLQDEYQPLTQGDTISNGQEWSTESFDFEVDFDIDILGIHSRNFEAMQGVIRMDTIVGDSTANVVASGFATDLVSRSGRPELSPVIMNLDGPDGERVLTIEYRNAYFSCLDGEGDFINFQIKYFELDRSFEFHYGNSATSRIEAIIDQKGMIFGGVVGLAVGDSLDVQDAYLLAGNAENPILVRKNDMLVGFPEEGSIYRFAPKTTRDHDLNLRPTCVALNEWVNSSTPQPYSSSSRVSIHDITGSLLFVGNRIERQQLHRFHLTHRYPIIVRDHGCPESVKVMLP